MDMRCTILVNVLYQNFINFFVLRERNFVNLTTLVYSLPITYGGRIDLYYSDYRPIIRLHLLQYNNFCAYNVNHSEFI